MRASVWPQRWDLFSAWMVHAFTASGALVALLTFDAIVKGEYRNAFLWMAVAVLIDSVDGTLARKLQVKTRIPSLDGALLDNIVDYLNYVITPAYLLLVHPSMVPYGWRIFLASAIALSSAYQFAQADAKTPDNFFKGFPSYWNIVVFYLFIFAVPAWLNAAIIMALVGMVFVPIKYLYLSRMTHVTHSRVIKNVIAVASVLFALANVVLLMPDSMFYDAAAIWVLVFVAVYFAFSVYRTLRPLPERGRPT